MLDDRAHPRKTITTRPLNLDVDLDGVDRIRFEFTPPGNSCDEYSRMAFVALTAQP